MWDEQDSETRVHENIPQTLISQGLDSILLQYGEGTSGPDTRIDIVGTPWLDGIEYQAREQPPIQDGPVTHHREPVPTAVILTIRIEPDEATGVAFTASVAPRVDLDEDGRISIHQGAHPTNGTRGVSQS